MNKRNLFRSLVLVIAVLSIFLTAAAPYPLRSSSNKVLQAGELVKLTIDNRTDKELRLWLTGPSFYYLTVPANSAEVFTPKRGEYNASFAVCGIILNETLDLTKNTRVIQPACGIKGQAQTNPSTINLGQIEKLVRVYFENDTPGTLTIVLSGPATYVLTLSKEQKNDYTIIKGDYDVTMYAYGCGSVTQTTFTATSQAKKVFKCPK